MIFSLQAAEPATVTVETEGAIPPEVADQVIESATAALEDVDKAKAEADEVQIDPVPGLGTGVSFPGRQATHLNIRAQS